MVCKIENLVGTTCGHKQKDCGANTGCWFEGCKDFPYEEFSPTPCYPVGPPSSGSTIIHFILGKSLGILPNSSTDVPIYGGGNKLCREVHGAIEQFRKSIVEKVPEEKNLLDKLYMILDEDLANAGIGDQKATTKIVNKFIHCHTTILHAGKCTTTLDQTMNSMQARFSRLT